jgi:hypothetical protein
MRKFLLTILVIIFAFTNTTNTIFADGEIKINRESALTFFGTLIDDIPTSYNYIQLNIPNIIK